MRALVVLVLFVGCIEPGLVPCGDQLCPIGQLCTAGGCATVDEVGACVGKVDGDPCSTDEIVRGACESGACRATACGDGVRSLDEVCDDGNTIDGDDCSSTCVSLEVCGNGIVDLVDDEQCDDGVPGLSGDGCSSTCQGETAAWRDVTPREISARSGAAMAYDAERGRTVVFGGATSSGPLGDTWVWDNVRWTVLDPLVSPSPRRNAAMAYDATRKEVILYGGAGELGPLGDTWRWDGTNWAQLSPVVSPGLRTGAAMAYYAQSQSIILHGGGGAQDSWDWNGVRWTLVSSELYPLGGPGVTNPAMAPFGDELLIYGAPSGEQYPETYLSSGGARFASIAQAVGYPSVLNGVHLAYAGTKLVMFGGSYGSDLPSAETWELASGGSWTEIIGATRPAARTGAGMVYDGQRVVLFGGATSTGPVNDTWTYTAGTWTSRVSAPRSPPAQSAPCVYDAVRGRVVLVPGFTAPWAGRHDRWAQLAGTFPNGRYNHAIAYDSMRGVVVLFGGEFAGRLDDTWELGDQGWVQRAPATRPARRSEHAMAYDAARGQVVMFGGGLGGLDGDAHTWTYDGQDWTPHTISNPAPRRGHRLAYDAARQRVVMFGGYDGTLLLAEIWEWDGNAWEQRTPAASPPPRWHHALVYDPLRQRVVLVGGTDADGTSFSDTWEWDGTTSTWTPITALDGPARRGHCGAFDAIGRQLIIFGGFGFFGNVTNEIWALSFANDAQQPERCRLANDDLDADGLAGCADPDCWGRCSPHCAPGTTCAPGSPRCGDGACSVIEDHDLCPADCP